MRIRFLLLLACCAHAAVMHAQTLAFPEAEGFGRFATGARTNLAAATVYHVTNLNNSGPGSLRDALSQPNRFVVFDVGGIINISSVVTVASNITIAGQTAPGGIQVYGNRVAFHGANNLISRYWAVRGSSSMGRNDAASLVRGQNMIWDHMSITWGVDGTFDINPDSGQTIDNLTIQNSIIGQGLDSVGHSTGGLMTIGTGNRFSLIKNLLIDNATRNPKARGENEFINNVVYGWEQGGYQMGDTGAISNANAEGNYFIYGVGNRYDHTGAYININPSAPFSSGSPSFSIYGNDNWVDGNRDGVLNGTPITSYPGSTVLSSRHASFPTTTTMTAQQTVPYIIENVGPNITRDSVDTRLVQEVVSYGTLGSVILRESDLFPNYGTNPSYLNPRARFVDADNDGIADNWELSRGLNPANANDWKGLNGGYTRLEEYINELGAIGTTVNSTGGVWNTPGTWAGSTPNLADTAVATGNLSVASGHAFARRLSVNGSLDVTGGTLDVFDTAMLDGTATIGGTFTAGRVQLGSFGQTGALAIAQGGTLQSGTVQSGGGGGTFAINGGTFRATGAPNITVPVALGAAGGTFDTNGYSGAITGVLSGSGQFTKNGAGDLRLSGANNFTGPTVVNGGTLSATTSAAIQNSASIELHQGTTLNVASIAGGYVTGNGQVIHGAGQITGSLVTTAGSVLRPQGGEFILTAHMIGIQAESMSLGSDWAVFDNAVHGTGAGGSYNGAGLSGGGIIMLSNAGATVPAATGVASTSIEVPVSGTWYLYSRTVEPTLSPIPGDTATHPGGNNSFFTSAQASSLQATTSNYDEVQTRDTPGNVAAWNLISTSVTPLAGVVSPLNAGITYSLTSGTKQFAVYGRESGTIIDAFVLSTTNLTAAQLDSVLTGTTVLGYSTGTTISGNYTQQANSVLEIQLGSSNHSPLLVSSTANLAGNLAVELVEGFVPQPSDSFTILSVGNLVNTFAGLPDGSRVNTIGGNGSFEIDYDYVNKRVVLSNFLAGIAGDFDGDGDVDGRDFLVWQRNPSVDDLSDWQTNYGVGSFNTANVAVPEPGTLLLSTLAALAWLARR